jgi:hypothetical protein
MDIVSEDRKPDEAGDEPIDPRIIEDLRSLKRVQAPPGFETRLASAISKEKYARSDGKESILAMWWHMIGEWPVIARGAAAAAVCILFAVIIAQFAPTYNAPVEAGLNDVKQDQHSIASAESPRHQDDDGILHDEMMSRQAPPVQNGTGTQAPSSTTETEIDINRRTLPEREAKEAPGVQNSLQETRTTAQPTEIPMGVRGVINESDQVDAKSTLNQQASPLQVKKTVSTVDSVKDSVKRKALKGDSAARKAVIKPKPR